MVDALTRPEPLPAPASPPGLSPLGLSGWMEGRGRVRGLVLIGVTVGVFYLLFRRIDLNQTLAVIRTIPAGTWLLATLLTLSFPVLSALRWHLILRVAGHQIGVWRCVTVIIGVWPISAISPSKAGDLLKTLALRREADPLVVAGTVLAERVIDVLVLAGLALAGGLVFSRVPIVGVAAAALAASLAVIAVADLGLRLPLPPKWSARVAQLSVPLRALRRSGGALALVLLLTVANWAASIVQTKLLFDAAHAHVSLGFTTAALPVAIFAGLLPVTIGGMGTRDAAMVALFAAYATADQTLAVAILYSFFGYWLLAMLGLPLTKRALAL